MPARRFRGTWLDHVRTHTSIPIAFGELFTDGGQYVPVVAERRVDFVRFDNRRRGAAVSDGRGSMAFIRLAVRVDRILDSHDGVAGAVVAGSR